MTFKATEMAVSRFRDVEMGRIMRDDCKWMPDFNSGKRRPNSGGRFEHMPCGVTGHEVPFSSWFKGLKKYF